MSIGWKSAERSAKRASSVRTWSCIVASPLPWDRTASGLTISSPMKDFSPQRHMILYHVNIGFPLLSENSRLKFDVSATIPEDPNLDQGVKDWMVFQPPTPVTWSKISSIFRFRMSRAGQWQSLRIRKLNLGLRLSFDTSTLAVSQRVEDDGRRPVRIGYRADELRRDKNLDLRNEQNLLPISGSSERAVTMHWKSRSSSIR